MNLNRCIHLIERQNRFRKIEDDKYESGFWDVAEATAQLLLGGSIFFHKKQDEKSFYGGTILAYRITTKQDSEKYAGRIIFIFRFSPDHRDVKTDIHGWGNEKKIVLAE